MQKFVSKDFKCLRGEITIPSDKSISHRGIILGALANGKSILKNFSNGQDPHSTLNIFKQLGLNIQYNNPSEVIINSDGKLSAPTEFLECNNSGTTMRLLSGVLAGQEFNSTLTGDDSLSKRPMKRVIEPLSKMGAKIESNDFKAPLKIFGCGRQNFRL